MFIIIEGVDGSGKTTLCKQLRKIGAKEINIGQYSENQLTQYLTVANESIISNSLVICDRSFISDIVYRLADDRERSALDLVEMCCILRLSKIILCETDSAFEDSIVRGEFNITSEKKSKELAYLYNIITTMFKKFLDVPIMKYNWQKQHINDVLKFIKGGSTWSTTNSLPIV